MQGCFMRYKEFREKEVINVANGKCLGYICDIEIDENTGCICAIYIPGPGKIGGILCRDSCFCIEYRCIVRIGPDIILVNCPDNCSNKK